MVHQQHSITNPSITAGMPSSYDVTAKYGSAPGANAENENMKTMVPIGERLYKTVNWCLINAFMCKLDQENVIYS